MHEGYTLIIFYEETGLPPYIYIYIYIYCIILFDIRMPKILKRVCCAVTMTVWRHRNRLWIMSFWTATRLLAGSSPSWGEWILGWICHWLVFPRSADEACQLGWQASLQSVCYLSAFDFFDSVCIHTVFLFEQWHLWSYTQHGYTYARKAAHMQNIFL